MLKFNERFEAERVQFCWHLHEYKEGTNRKGESMRSCYTTYYPTLKQVCMEIIDRSLSTATCAKSAKDILERINETIKDTIND